MIPRRAREFRAFGACSPAGEDAQAAARISTDVLTRAYTLCTLAHALARSGDHAGARMALARAHMIAPDLSRIYTVARLSGGSRPS